MPTLLQTLRRALGYPAAPPIPEPTDPPTTPPPISEQPIYAPHCSGRHGPADGRTCEWCDALTGLITLVHRLEREVVELRTAKGRG